MNKEIGDHTHLGDEDDALTVQSIRATSTQPLYINLLGRLLSEILGIST